MASIIKRKKNYSIVYTYVDENGETKQKWETRTSYQEALKRKAEIESQKSSNSFLPPTNQNTAEFLSDFVSLYGEKRWGVMEIQYKEQIETCFQQLGLDSTALVLPARKLSGGQKRRVALLRALLAPSDTLLLDEPFTGMDPETLQKAAALIRERGGGKNVLLATHDRDAIAALGWPVIQLAE